MRKLSLIFPILSLLLAGCTTNNVDNNQTALNYEISETSLTLEVGDKRNLYVSENGTISDKVTWSSDNTKVAMVSSSGEVVAIKEGTANITGKINKNTKLDCKVTVTAKGSSSGGGGGSTDNDTEIVKFFKNNSDYVDDKKEVYGFVSAKSRYDNYTGKYLLWNLYFLYDTSDDTCMIKSNLSGTTSNNYKYNYYGYNVFDWGDYKNGLFYGGYNQETSPGSDVYGKFEVLYDNASLVFRTDHEIVSGYDINYSVTVNQFSEDVSADNVLEVLRRVEECCSYAKEMFEKFKVNLTLY